MELFLPVCTLFHSFELPFFGDTLFIVQKRGCGKLLSMISYSELCALEMRRISQLIQSGDKEICENHGANNIANIRIDRTLIWITNIVSQLNRLPNTRKFRLTNIVSNKRHTARCCWRLADLNRLAQFALNECCSFSWIWRRTNDIQGNMIIEGLSGHKRNPIRQTN